MRKKLIKAGVLLGVFLTALVVSSLIINRGTEDATVDMGDPILPRVYFSVEGYKINTLFGYVEEMDITAMRDTITPLDAKDSLTLGIEKGKEKITQVKYEVYSLDGEEVYKTGKVEDFSAEEIQICLDSALGEDVQEAVLRMILVTEEREIYYYTRIERPDELSVKECLQFAQDFHDKTFDESKAEALSVYLEPDETSDNTTYQTVNIHSDIHHISWGELQPEITGEVEWSLKESNTVYTSVLAKYQVACKGESSEVETYNIKEFFRVRLSEGEMYLLDYNRSMNQVFDGTAKVLDQNGILLGITPQDIAYETNNEDTMLAFVQERDLWLYNKEEDTFTQIFSFANKEGYDVRSRNDQHAVRVISMEEDGSMVFAVYGYMNQGGHEGEVGVAVYDYDSKKNAVEEKAFIPSTKSFAVAEDEFGKMVYYSNEQEVLYVLAGGTLYQIDLDKDKKAVLAEDLEEGQYIVSADGHLLAYQTNGSLNSALEIKVLDLSVGDSYTIEAKKGEAVRPLGFVAEDFIYGKIHPEDAGKSVAGDEIAPMYELEIRDTENRAVKNYASEDTFISDIIVEDNLVTINRVVKSGEVYHASSPDYITNNEERNDSGVVLETVATDLKETQMRFTFEKELKSQSPKILRANQVLKERPITVSLSDKSRQKKYYVYGVGELAAVYDKAGYAIQKAEQVSGVVISSDQSYVWEKGNRDLVYYTDAGTFKKEEGESSLEACERYMEQYAPEAEKMDLTGCTLNQVLYVINKGCPVIALTDSSHAILLTGYSTTDVTYVDPNTGEENTVSVNDMEAMISGSGNTFIGYVK
ncbi:hypothetical protein DWX08_08315 [Ruminococcus sp. AF18-22]|nr:hypothetical protein DWX08_08315 [Ruminococcus sp. AF18-22]